MTDLEDHDQGHIFKHYYLSAIVGYYTLCHVYKTIIRAFKHFKKFYF